MSSGSHNAALRCIHCCCTKACMTGAPCLSRDAELLYQARYGKQDKMTKEQYAALKRKVGGQPDHQHQLPLPLPRLHSLASAHAVLCVAVTVLGLGWDHAGCCRCAISACGLSDPA